MNPQSDLITTVIKVGSLATDNTQIPAINFARKARIVKAVLANGAAIAASDTDYAQLTLQKVGGGVVAEFDTRALHENGLAKNVGEAMNLGSEELTLIPAGTDLEVDYQEAGTIALTEAVISLTYYYL